MAMPFQPWRARLRPASFRGVSFKIEVGGLGTGRRTVEHEYPKADTPYAEDMGRRARRWPVTGYVIGPNYLDARDALIAACEAEGAGTLVHPSLGDHQVNCDTCNVTESRERGGFCSFEMLFVEAGQDPDAAPADDTRAQVGSAANTSDAAAASSLNTSTGGKGGIGSDYVASMQASKATTSDASLGLSSSTSGLA